MMRCEPERHSGRKQCKLRANAESQHSPVRNCAPEGTLNSMRFRGRVSQVASAPRNDDDHAIGLVGWMNGHGLASEPFSTSIAIT